MFRRVRWMAVGATAGIVGEVWARRQAKRAVERLDPAAVGRRAAKTVGGRLSDAAHDAARAKAETESRLRRRFAPEE